MCHQIPAAIVMHCLCEYTTAYVITFEIMFIYIYMWFKVVFIRYKVVIYGTDTSEVFVYRSQ